MGTLCGEGKYQGLLVKRRLLLRSNNQLFANTSIAVFLFDGETGNLHGFVFFIENQLATPN